MMVMKKKGLEMAITTVIMIILSIAVLTVLVVFFNSQTGFLSRWFGTQTSESNVDAVVSGCESLVTSESLYSYCCEKKEVIFGNKDNRGNVRVTCNVASGEDWSSGRIGKLDCSAVSCVE